jgi:hypothetical protein
MPHVAPGEAAKQPVNLLLQRHGDPRLCLLATEQLHQHEIVSLDHQPLQVEPKRQAETADHRACLDDADRGVVRRLGEREHDAASAVADGATDTRSS